MFSSQQRPDGKLWNDVLGNGKKLSFIDILKEGNKLMKNKNKNKKNIVFKLDAK